MRSNPVRLLLHSLPILALGAMTLSGALACGSDDGTRGLQPSNEVAVPNSVAEDAETEAERRQKQIAEMQQEQARALQQAEEH